MTRRELIRVKPSYKLVVYLFSGPLYDLCDFEVLDSKPPHPKIDLDSIVQDIAAIVLVQLKTPKQAPTDTILHSDDIEVAKDEITVSESSSDDEEESKQDISMTSTS